MTAWKNGNYDAPDATPPCAIEPGGFYVMRNGGHAFVEELYEIGFMYNDEKRAWYGWRGLIIADGSKCSWDLDGGYSPVALHECDLVTLLE